MTLHYEKIKYSNKEILKKIKLFHYFEYKFKKF